MHRHVLAKIRAWPAARRYWVACSGGPDSVALLDVMKGLERELPGPLAVVHVNHGLHPAAAAWQRHVEALAAELGLPCAVHRIRVADSARRGPEAAARDARYRALGRSVGGGELVVTAHHRDDQAETVLLQLLRGAGPAGLAGVAELGPFAGGWLGRPCLELARAELRAHCLRQGRAWVDDPSNRDVRLRRNRIRQEILPRLEQGWPGASQVLARAARVQGEASELLASLAQSDLREALEEPGGGLRVGALRRLEPSRAANLLRGWLSARGLPAPSRAQLEGLLAVALGAREDASVEYRWPGALVRRYRGTLHAAAPGASPRAAVLPRIVWDLPQPLSVAGGCLSAVRGRGPGLALARLDGVRVEVRWREGGERCRPAGRQVTKTVKAVLREAGVPPWERACLPLVYADGTLAAIPGICYCEPYAAAAGEAAWQVEWRRDAG